MPAPVPLIATFAPLGILLVGGVGLVLTHVLKESKEYGVGIQINNFLQDIDLEYAGIETLTSSVSTPHDTIIEKGSEGTAGIYASHSQAAGIIRYKLHDTGSEDNFRCIDIAWFTGGNNVFHGFGINVGWYDCYYNKDVINSYVDMASGVDYDYVHEGWLLTDDGKKAQNWIVKPSKLTGTEVVVVDGTKSIAVAGTMGTTDKTTLKIDVYSCDFIKICD